MAAPEGYTALDFVGFTDKGSYSATEPYMKNDLVHAGNTVWRCLVDNTTGVEPQEGTTWTLFIEGEKPYEGTYTTFPRPPLAKDKDKFFVDIETDPRLMYTWDDTKQDYVLTGGAGGADGSSVDIPITLPATAWTGTSAPYSQTVTVPQMREDMTPFVILTDSDTLTDAQRYAFSLLTDYDAAYAQMTFYAADKPTVDIPVTLKGIPAQEPEFVDNTVVLIVEPSGFALSTDPEYDGRYVSTITVTGMSAGAEGASWDIVRSGPVLSLEESKIAASITDVKPMDGAVQIVCTEIPAATYLLKITGSYADATPGDVILPNLLTWMNDTTSQITIMQDVLARSRNSQPRGKDITDQYYSGYFSEQVAAQTFKDIYPCDYIIGQNSSRKYIVGDINYRLRCGDTPLNTPHVLMFPERSMYTAKMNDTNTTAGGYAGSKMRTTNLNTAKTIIKGDFGNDHVINHRNLFVNVITSNYPSAGAWFDSDVDLMNECMIYGSYIHSPANYLGATIPYLYTIDKSQIAAFRLCPDLISCLNDDGVRAYYWNRDVINALYFGYVNGGSSDCGNASAALGVRPAFLIK